MLSFCLVDVENAMPFLVGSCMIRRLFSLCAGYLKKKKEGIQHNALHSVHFACKLVIFFLLFFLAYINTTSSVSISLQLKT